GHRGDVRGATASVEPPHLAARGVDERPAAALRVDEPQVLRRDEGRAEDAELLLLFGELRDGAAMTASRGQVVTIPRAVAVPVAERRRPTSAAASSTASSVLGAAAQGDPQDQSDGADPQLDDP